LGGFLPEAGSVFGEKYNKPRPKTKQKQPRGIGSCRSQLSEKIDRRYDKSDRNLLLQPAARKESSTGHKPHFSGNAEKVIARSP